MTGFPSEDNKYLFNGDFVDRGVWSVEVMIVLLGFKLLLPGLFRIRCPNLKPLLGYYHEDT